MRWSSSANWRSLSQWISLLVLTSSLAGCGGQGDGAAAGDAVVTFDPCSIALVPHTGESTLDQRIRELQSTSRSVMASDRSRARPWLERLGFTYVQASKAQYDAGLLSLAERTARCVLEVAAPGQEATGRLLLGRVRHQQHRFANAQRIAERLVGERGWWFDYALLGDVLLDRGHYAGAAEAYQQVADQRPGPHAYRRAAELRWVHGDPEGAMRMLRKVLQSTEISEADLAADALTRLADWQWQLGATQAAERTLARTEALHPANVKARYLRARMHLARGDAAAAVALLQPLVAQYEAPEHRWALIEALEATGEPARAHAQIERLQGSVEDPRTLALFLATRQIDLARARQLAMAELEVRADPKTLDAAAWVAWRAGDEALAASFDGPLARFAYRDGRLCLHQALVAERRQAYDALRAHAECARTFAHTLLPSERTLLDRLVSSPAMERTAVDISRTSPQGDGALAALAGDSATTQAF
ncbi:MAG: hypothetical protein AAFX85_00475 [Pseudomonadota bacterium]